MSFSIAGYFTQRDWAYGDIAQSASDLAKWSTFPSIVTADCEQKVKGSSAVKDFYAHFNPVSVSVQCCVVELNCCFKGLQAIAHFPLGSVGTASV